MTSCCKQEPIITVSIPETTLELKVGETYNLTLIVQEDNVVDINNNALASWTSSNIGVATVNEFGYVTAVSAGECFITATYKEISDSCALTVKE